MNLIHLCFLILLGLIQSFGSSATAYAKAEASLLVQSADAANHEYTAANPFAENLAVAFLIAESVDEEEEEESQTEPTSDCTFVCHACMLLIGCKSRTGPEGRNR
jgi:hypothetical protein